MVIFSDGDSGDLNATVSEDGNDIIFSLAFSPPATLGESAVYEYTSPITMERDADAPADANAFFVKIPLDPLTDTLAENWAVVLRSAFSLAHPYNSAVIEVGFTLNGQLLTTPSGSPYAMSTTVSSGPFKMLVVGDGNGHVTAEILEDIPEEDY